MVVALRSGLGRLDGAAIGGARIYGTGRLGPGEVSAELQKARLDSVDFR